MRKHARRNRGRRSRVISSLALLAPVAAFAETNLRWVMPTDSPPADEFRVYVGPPISDEGYLVYTGLPIPDADGVYSADVQIDEVDQGIPVYRLPRDLLGFSHRHGGVVSAVTRDWDAEEE